MVEIEINGKKLSVEPGAMIIEVADSAGIDIPRFCYHKKLSIAANCRMCLVEVDKIRKPVPACATPITDGMKVFTKSPMALESQRAVMEFLLINHPLDCPICDQGGECELQDLALGYGDDISQYHEGKRVVNDKNIGPLISTDLTRCIQCTRCVRFGDEIAGVRELGMIGRGEHEMIATYMSKTVDSELSGNVIDLCPVGALTNKPYRYTARPWELTQRPTIAPHDCVGANIFAHTRSAKVMRTVPQENETINETWSSDRDRYSYQGLNSSDRLAQPLMKDDNGVWQAVEWETALNRVVNGLSYIVAHHQAEQIGALISPNSTLEEAYLAQKLLRSLGSDNIDHRLRQHDFSDDAYLPCSPASAATMADIADADRILVIGSHTRKDQPLIAHRIRMAHLNGASISMVNPVDYDFAFDIEVKAIVKMSQLAHCVAGIVKAVCELQNETVPEFVKQITPSDTEKAIAQQIQSGEKKIICVGELALHHQDAALLRTLTRELSRLSGAKLISLYNGGNNVGAWLAGAVPHRKPGGVVVEKPGMNAAAMLSNALKAYLLMAIEPEFDTAFGETAKATLSQAEFVVALTYYDTPAMRDYADVMLPIAPFTETSGTFVNFAGMWQSFAGVVAPLGATRPAWKVLRVLGNLLQLPGFEYDSTEQIRQRVQQLVDASPVEEKYASSHISWPEPSPAPVKGVLERIVEVPMYSVDPIVRRGSALQKTKDAQVAVAGIHPATAQELGLCEGQSVTISSANNVSYAAVLPLKFNKRLLPGTVWIAAGIPETMSLGATHTQVILEGV